MPQLHFPEPPRRLRRGASSRGQELGSSATPSVLRRVSPTQKEEGTLLKSTMKRAAAATAVASIGIVGFGTAAGAHSPNTHVVQPGDTLSLLAPENWREVAAGNGISNPNMIYVGQVIDLNATAAAPAPESQSSSTSGGSESEESYSDDSDSGSGEEAAASAPASTGGGGTVWDQLAECESGGNWGTSTGNGYYGGLQFSQGSWNAAGGSGNPANASREEQIRVAENLQAQQGWGAWPACSSELGLR
jgi:LysM repeat protein